MSSHTAGDTGDGLPTPESLDELEHLAEAEGLEGLRVAERLIEDELRAKSPVRRSVEIVLSLAVVVAVFGFVMPGLGSDYGRTWARLRDIDLTVLLGMFAFWFFTMWCIAGVLSHSLPGLKQVQGMVMNFSGSALANVLFPRTAAEVVEADRHRVFAKGSRLAVLSTACVTVAVIAVTPWMVPLLFGGAFAAAIPAALVLVGAAAIAAVNMVLEDGLRGLGRPVLVLWAELGGLVVTAIAHPEGLAGTRLAKARRKRDAAADHPAPLPRAMEAV